MTSSKVELTSETPTLHLLPLLHPFSSMLATTRIPRNTLLSLQQTNPFNRYSPSSPPHSRFIRTPRHARSAAARAKAQTGDGGGGGSLAGALGTTGTEGDDGMKRTRSINPREVSSLQQSMRIIELMNCERIARISSQRLRSWTRKS